jgi:hypothetical protein
MTKTCNGPSHPAPVSLPLDERHWHFRLTGRRAGHTLSRCKACQNWEKLRTKNGPHGLVAVKAVRPHALELLERCGGYAAVRRLHGINDTTLRPVVWGDNPTVQLRTVQRILDALVAQRINDRRAASISPVFLNATTARVRNAQRIERRQ